MADFGGYPFGGIAAQIGDHNFRTLGGKAAGDPFAKPAASAGDDGYFSFKTHGFDPLESD